MALESWIEHADGTMPLNRLLDGCEAACNEYHGVMYRVVPIEEMQHPSEWSEEKQDAHMRCNTICEMGVGDLEVMTKMLRLCLEWLDDARMYRQIKTLHDMALANDLDVPIRK